MIARRLLAEQELIDLYLKQCRWAELGALLRFVQRDVLPELASTDPALYKTLRAQVTRFYLSGRAVFSLSCIEALAAEQSEGKRKLLSREDRRVC